MRQFENSDKPQWLLLKSGEDVPPFSAKVDDQSVLSRRSMKQIAEAKDNEWQSNRKASNNRLTTGTRQSSEADEQPRSRRQTAASPSARSRRTTRESPREESSEKTEPKAEAQSTAFLPRAQLNKLPRAIPEFREPMKALLVETLPRGENWSYELKFDGIRALGIKRKGNVELVSRTGKNLTTKYPQVADALKQLAAREFLLDGEVVALDPEGRSSFQLLQSYEMSGKNKPPLFYYVFDLLNLDGRDLAQLPLQQRKALAQTLLAGAPSALRFSPALKAASEKLMREMKARGLEGLIAKKQDSKYEWGRRSGAWVKFKWTNEQEFVIGGYTPPQGSRSRFGAILVGYYEGKKLLYAGKVGTGFDDKTLDLLYSKFQKLIRSICPFANLPEKLSGSGAKGMTASEMRRCTWLEPKLVCQVRFAEWTRDHHLRQPSFLGLREDRRPEEVVRETPA
jgi:bifunctional non-homologous end joining protein LigD